MTALCIWIAGGVSSFVVSAVLPGRIVSSSPGPSLIVFALAAAFGGAFVLRAVLPRLAGASISYAWAAIALGVGSLAGNGVIIVVRALVLSHASAAAPVLGSNPAFALGAMAIGFLVSYQVITFAAAQPSRVGAARVPTEAEDRYDTSPLSGMLGDVVARTQQAVAQACIDISRSPGDQIPGVVVDALTELGTCTHGLQHSTTTDPALRAEVERLLDAVNRFQTALAQIADDAAATGSDRMYQRGIIWGR
jgi:hypothetical protein